MRWIGRSCLLFGLATLLLFAVELGLQTRAWLDEKFSTAKSLYVSSAHRVLLIGDSVLGVGQDNSIASRLQDHLAKSGHSYEVINLSTPANSSGRVNSLIQDYLATYQPDLVVLLLGRSDQVLPQIDRSQINSLIWQYHRLVSHLKILRLSILAFESIHRWNNRIAALISSRHQTPPSPMTQIQNLAGQKQYQQLWSFLNQIRETHASSSNPFLRCYATGWMAKIAQMIHPANSESYLKETLSCAGQIEQTRLVSEPLELIYSLVGEVYQKSEQTQLAKQYFDKSVAIHPSEVSLTESSWFYYAQGDCRAAVPAFEKTLRLRPSYRRGIWALFDCYRKSDQMARGVAFFHEILSSSDEKSLLNQLLLTLDLVSASEMAHNKLNSFSATDPDSYLTALWLAKRQSNVKEANQLFANAPKYGPSRDATLDEKAYRDILGKIVASGTRVIALQYPNESDWTITHATAPFLSGVSHFSLHEALADTLQQHSIFDLLDDDFIHVTPLGAEILGHAIANQILISLGDA